MSDPTVKFCLDHPQKVLQIFQASGMAGRFGLVKPGHPPKFSPFCLFLEDTFKIVIDTAKKKVQFSRGLMDSLPYKFAMVYTILSVLFVLYFIDKSMITIS